MKMRNIFLLVVNTLKVTFRKKSNFIIYLLLPLAGVLMSVAIYSGAGSSVLRVGVLDRDATTLSRDYVQSLTNSDGFKVSAIEEDGVNKSLVDRKLDAVVTIPAGYGESIYGGKPLNMEIVSLKGQESTAWLSNYISIYTRNLADLSLAAGHDRSKFNMIYDDYRSSPLKLENVKVNAHSRGQEYSLV
jgi:ABC-2 type transport system permease protein